MNIENLLESRIRELQSRGITNVEYEELYKDINNERVKKLFTWLHGGYISLFSKLNERLPTGEYEAHFWAEPSRELIFVIEFTISLQGILKKTEWAFTIEEYYDAVIKKCRDFLSNSGGSKIPPHMKKVELYYLDPIFLLTESVKVTSERSSFVANLKPIGQGSYAHVFKYKDEYYNHFFVLKRAKTDLNEKERIRFRREFDEMASLHSPYIVEVYSYDEIRHEYTMELMDCTLEKYFEKHNSSILMQTRKSIIMQLMRAYRYLHSKNIYHRDISPKNVLLKIYDDVLIVKLSDFGLVKIVESDLTSENTDFKGSLNDPALKVEGFGNYGLLHEIYAMTLLFAFILTGKTNWAKITDPAIRSFIAKGTNPDKAQRYQSLDELGDAVMNCIKTLE